MDTVASADRYAGLIEDLRRVGAQPLWDRYHRLNSRAPAAADAPWHWPWSVMEPLIARATREVGMEDAERRVLLLSNPALPEFGASTTNLTSGLQTLLPGEVARAHRHTLQAIRFVMQGQGAETRVNSQRCAMHEGDLILTPAWTWHEHAHAGTERIVWFDGLDLPLGRMLDIEFFEIAGADAVAVDPHVPPAISLREDAVALRPDGFEGGEGRNPYRYAWERAHAGLSAASPAADGSRLLRYVNGQNGGAALPSLDCYLMACARGRATRRYRSTANAVCVVVQGQGRSVVGDTTIAWKPHDVFSLPHWNWISHTASEDAIIFSMTDREVLAALGYLREEFE